MIAACSEVATFILFVRLRVPLVWYLISACSAISAVNRISPPYEAVNRDHRSADLTSIIIPCWGQLEFTQQCSPRLKEHTRPAWELPLLSTMDRLMGRLFISPALSDMASVPMTIVTNSQNVGFPAAINQGLQFAPAGIIWCC